MGSIEVDAPALLATRGKPEDLDGRDAPEPRQHWSVNYCLPLQIPYPRLLRCTTDDPENAGSIHVRLCAGTRGARSFRRHAGRSLYEDALAAEISSELAAFDEADQNVPIKLEHDRLSPDPSHLHTARHVICKLERRIGILDVAQYASDDFPVYDEVVRFCLDSVSLAGESNRSVY